MHPLVESLQKGGAGIELEGRTTVGASFSDDGNYLVEEGKLRQVIKALELASGKYKKKTNKAMKPVVRWGDSPEKLTGTVPAAQLLIRTHPSAGGENPLFKDAPAETRQFEATITGLKPATTFGREEFYLFDVLWAMRTGDLLDGRRLPTGATAMRIERQETQVTHNGQQSIGTLGVAAACLVFLKNRVVVQQSHRMSRNLITANRQKQRQLPSVGSYWLQWKASIFSPHSFEYFALWRTLSCI